MWREYRGVLRVSFTLCDFFSVVKGSKATTCSQFDERQGVLSFVGYWYVKTYKVMWREYRGVLRISFTLCDFFSVAKGSKATTCSQFDKRQGVFYFVG